MALPSRKRATEAEVQTIILIDPQEITRWGTRMLFSRHDNYQIIAETSSGNEGLRLLAEHLPTLAIVDVRVEDIGGIDLIRTIKERHPATRVLVLTNSVESFTEAILAGANGYLLKCEELNVMEEAVCAVLQGRRFIGPKLSQALIHRQIAQVTDGNNSSGDQEQRLTRREAEILQLLSEGHSIREIADKLFISPRTVHNHRTNVMRKLNVHSTIHLVRHALTKGPLNVVAWGATLVTEAVLLSELVPFA